MENFRTWWPEGMPNWTRSPTDLDCVLHDRATRSLFFIEFKDGVEVPIGQRMVKETLALQRGFLVMAVDESLTSVAGKRQGWNASPMEDGEMIRIAAPPKWAWRPVTIGWLRELLLRWAWRERRPWVERALHRLGHCAPNEPLDLEALKERLERHGWEPVRSVQDLAGVEDRPGGDPAPSSGVDEALPPGTPQPAPSPPRPLARVPLPNGDLFA